jgi:hypothetical protein
MGSNVSGVTPLVSLLRRLSDEGFVFEPIEGGGGYRFESRHGTMLPLRPVLTVSEETFDEYLDAMSHDLREMPDPRAEALSLTKIHVVEELSTDHGDGLNYVRALGYRRGRGGRVEFFVDQEIPEPRDVPAPGTYEWRA